MSYHVRCLPHSCQTTCWKLNTKQNIVAIIAVYLRTWSEILRLRKMMRAKWYRKKKKPTAQIIVDIIVSVVCLWCFLATSVNKLKPKCFVRYFVSGCSEHSDMLENQQNHPKMCHRGEIQCTCYYCTIFGHTVSWILVWLKSKLFCVFFHTFCLRTLIILLININNQSLNNTYTRAHTMLNVFEVVHNWRMFYKVRCVLFSFIHFTQVLNMWFEWVYRKKETNGEWMKYHSASCKHIKCAWNISEKFLDSRNF